MNSGTLHPFSLAQLASPALVILLLGFLIAFWETRNRYLSLLVAAAKSALFVAYFGVLFDGTFTFLDDWGYLRVGHRLEEQGISLVNFYPHLHELLANIGSLHILYYLYNADSFRVFGYEYYAPVTFNVVLTFIAAGFMSSAARNGLAFTKRQSVALFVFVAIHPTILAWSTVMNGKDTLVLALTSMVVYAVSVDDKERHVWGAILAIAAGGMLLFTRFYIPLFLFSAYFCAMVLSSASRRRIALWLLVPIGCAGVIAFVSLFGTRNVLVLLLANFSNPLYGFPHFLLTPIPFHTTQHYAFLNWPQMFHWVMLPALGYGIFRVWCRATLTARFAVIYFFVLMLFYSVFGAAQGPRQRYQLAGLVALFQFDGTMGGVRQLLAIMSRHRTFRRAKHRLGAKREALILRVAGTQ